MPKSKTRPYIIATALFLVIWLTQPTVSTGSQIVFDYIARFLFCLLIGFGVEWVVFKKKSSESSNLESSVKQSIEIPKTKLIEVRIKISDLNNPHMDMLTLEELFEDVKGKMPFTEYYDAFNQEPLSVILETTDQKEAEKIIKQKMDNALFLNLETNKEEKMFKKYEINEFENQGNNHQKDLNFVDIQEHSNVEYPNLTPHQAMSIQQYYINKAGLENLENKINEINSSRSIYAGSQQFAKDFIEKYKLPLDLKNK
jgi:hypothetical protein